MITIEDSVIINLNSNNAQSLNDTFLSNLVWQTNGVLKDEPNIMYCTISVANVQIPVSFYSVNYTNNILNYTIASIDYSITITVGNYNSDTFITELQTQFLLNGHTFIITLNTINGILTFSTVSLNFTFLSTSTCKSLLGFTTNSTSTSFSLQMSYPLNLLGIKKLKLCSHLLTTSNLDPTAGNLLFAIPNKVPAYEMIAWENTSNIVSILKVKQIDVIDIQILDENDAFINFNNQPCLITLRLGIFRNIISSNMSLTDLLKP